MELNNAELKKGERRLSVEFIQVFSGGKKTRINCAKSHSSESACMDAIELRIVWEEPQVALPELTRPEQTVLRSPWTMESWMLRTWTSE